MIGEGIANKAASAIRRQELRKQKQRSSVSRRKGIIVLTHQLWMCKNKAKSYESRTDISVVQKTRLKDMTHVLTFQLCNKQGKKHAVPHNHIFYPPRSQESYFGLNTAILPTES